MQTIPCLPADVRGLIFDCDGTLVDTPPVYARAWAAGLRVAGHALHPEWYFARAGMSEHMLMDQFEQQFNVVLPRDAVVRAMRAAFSEEVHGLREIAAVAAIARRNRGVRLMAVASGGPAPLVMASLHTTGLWPLFDTVVTIEDVARAKPEPDLFLEASRQLGLSPDLCLVFEDSREGLEAARRAGMRSVDVLGL